MVNLNAVETLNRNKRAIEMADDDEMPLTLPDTQNADILTQSQPEDSETHSQKILRIWGKLYPLEKTLKKIEMSKEIYLLGRSTDCDITIGEKELDDKKRSVISKQHFRIEREIIDSAIDDSVVYIEDTSHNGTFVNGVLVGHGKRILLENNDTIGLAQSRFSVYTYMSTRTSESSGLPPELKCKYAVSRTLGSGACGEVKMILSRNGCKRFALKTITKSKFLTTDVRSQFNDPDKIMTEVRILKDLRHPCIIRMEEILDTPSSVYIVLELMEGGELFDRIRKTVSGLSEKMAKLIFYQVSLAVHYLHERGITHRDLKPENILLASNSDKTLVKVSDFGLSKFVDTQTIMRTFCGTPMYVAPEVLLTHGRESYTNQVDIWSLGVILYCCLSGLVPFSINDRENSLQRQIIRGIYNFPTQRFSKVSFRVINLIKQMMTVDPEKRITINQLLLHPWLADREMRSTVGRLMNEQCEFNENTPPLSKASTSRAQVGLRMNPPISAFKRARVE